MSKKRARDVLWSTQVFPQAFRVQGEVSRLPMKINEQIVVRRPQFSRDGQDVGEALDLFGNISREVELIRQQLLHCLRGILFPAGQLTATDKYFAWHPFIDLR